MNKIRVSVQMFNRLYHSLYKIEIGASNADEEEVGCLSSSRGMPLGRSVHSFCLILSD
jgi:hypothetical protein